MRQALRKPSPFGNVRTAVLQAPIRGWRSDEGAAKEQPGAAIKLLNFIPQPDVVRLRRGYDSHATGMTDEVETLMVYTSSSNTAMFAAVGGFIYDASIAGAASVSLSGMSEARYSWTNMSTTGGQFLTIANGVDTVRVWNGAAWSEPGITGIVSTTVLNFVWQYKNREWFLKKNSMSAFYLPIDTIAGALLEFNIGSLFNRGGYLVAGATWSVDAGDGMDDLICFMTSEGELAIYSMVDPSDAANVFLKGVYYLGRPVGDRCLFKLGADLVAITNAGVVPISRVLTTGTEKLEEAALTAPIRHDYSDNAEVFGNLDGWQITAHPRSNLLILNIPTIERVEAKQFVMNILTGAWCEWNNINALCWTLFGEDIYFGGSAGVVYKAETGSQDAGQSITGEMILAFSQFGASARQKHIKMVRPNVYTNINSRGTVYVLPDYFNSQHVDISGDISGTGLSLWDDALWDIALWPGVNVIRQWRVGGNIGTALAIKFVITAATQTPEADLDYRVISFDVAHEVGGVL
jgi:hypothetical protein